MRNPLNAPPSPPFLKGNERPGPPPLLSEKQLRSGPGLSIFIGLFAVVAFCLIAWFGIYKDNIIIRHFSYVIHFFSKSFESKESSLMI